MGAFFYVHSLSLIIMIISSQADLCYYNDNDAWASIPESERPCTDEQLAELASNLLHDACRIFGYLNDEPEIPLGKCGELEYRDVRGYLSHINKFN